MDTRHFEVCPLDLIASRALPTKTALELARNFEQKPKKNPPPNPKNFTLLFLQTHPTGSGRAEP